MEWPFIKETYDEKVYDKVHLYGKKKNYQFRQELRNVLQKPDLEQ